MPITVAFANTAPTGAADDIALAIGSLISGKFTQNPAPGISILSDFTESFAAAIGVRDVNATRRA